MRALLQQALKAFETDDFMKKLMAAQAIRAELAKPWLTDAQPLKINKWSHNDGDSWFEHPADAQIIYDLLGDSPKVGDEFELRAGVSSVLQTYRVTEVSEDGDCEVEQVVRRVRGEGV